MIITKSKKILSSEITPREIYQKRKQLRREFLKTTAGLAAAGIASPLLAATTTRKLSPVNKTRYGKSLKLTPYEYVTGYNNFYEFGTSKSDPAKNAGTLKPHPWSVVIEGEVEKPATYHVEDLIHRNKLEERIYRHRCVEAWSMVIPWVGIPLADIIKRVRPTSRAKYVQFVTLLDPKQMPGQQPGLFGSGLSWPYVEGLRMDEAMNPLTLLAVGLYGEELPNQNGAPIRLVVPWKYGFKNIKSIVKIRFVEQQPPNTWNMTAPNEYGFYANVNPTVDHPRWSQARERRIGEDGLFTAKRKTLMFNGYADEVAHMYAGMDLRKFFLYPVMHFLIWPQRFDKSLLFVVALIPLGIILYDIWANQLGANPVEALSHRTGAWALRFLWFTLAITPLRKQFGWVRPVRLRRMLGLYAFFYASLHVFVYFVLDRSMLMSEIIGDITKRPYIMVGFAVFLMLIPLAATSNNRMIRRLGGQRWKRLHRLVYPAAIGANIHFFWLVKSDIREPLLYSVILLFLLSYRLPAFTKKQVSPVPR